MFLCVMLIPLYAQERGELRVIMEGKFYSGGNQKGRCENMIWVWLRSGNQEFYLGDTDMRGLNEMERRSFIYQITIPAGNNITGIRSRGVRRWTNWAGCSGNDDTRTTNYNIPLTTNSCFSGGVPNFPPNWDTDNVTIRIFPKSVKIAKKDENFIGATTSNTLLATTGFSASIYKWQYSFDGFSWVNFPSALNNNEKSSFTGLQLLGQDFYKNINKNIYFRIDYGCGDRYSNVITNKLILDAPKLISFTPISPLCFGERSGAVKLQFDRALVSNEILNLALAEVGHDTPFDNVENISQLDANNAYTLEIGKDGFDGLMAGTYTIKTISKIGDNITTPPPPFTITVSDPAPLRYTFSKQDIICFGANDGVITVQATGGTGSYFISLNGTAFVPFNAGATHQLNGQVPGSYTIQIRDSNGCIPKLENGAEDVRQTNLTQPHKALSIAFEELLNPKAFGYSDGQLTVVIDGGTQHATGGYTYQWKDQAGNPMPSHTGEIINSGDAYRIRLLNVPAGYYSLEVWDKNTNSSSNQANCYLSKAYTLTQPEPITGTINLVKDLACFNATDGEIQVTATGGVVTADNSYRYQWQQLLGGTYQSISGATAASLTGIGAGSYRVMLTDNNDITFTSSVYVLQQPERLIPRIDMTHSSCYGAHDGTITVQLSGGTGSYQIGLWSPGQLAYQWNNFNSGKSHLLTNRGPGTYRIKLRDANGCVPKDDNSLEISYEITLTEPAVLAIQNENILHPAAFGMANGELQVWLAGGTTNSAGGYAYQWKDANGNLLSSHSAQVENGTYHITLSGLTQGSYTLQVSDKNGCSIQKTYTLTQPEAIVVTIERVQQVSCFGGNDGQLRASVSGGITIPGIRYHYQWYRVEGSTLIPIGEDLPLASGLIAGDYTLVVTDANAISQRATTVSISEPSALQSSLVGYTAINCYGGDDGTITVSATGGTESYQVGIQKKGENRYTWLPFNQGNQHQFTGLIAGLYKIQIRDAHSCQEQVDGSNKTYEINLTAPAEPLSIRLLRRQEPLAHGQENGLIEVLVTGGTANPVTGDYSYVWKNADGEIIHSHQATATTAGYQINLHSIPAGTYTLFINDHAAIRCSTTKSYTLDQPDPLLVSLAITGTIACHNDNTGSIEATVIGGVPYPGNRYTYAWYRLANDGSEIHIDQLQQAMATALVAGNYYVRVTDANGIQVSSATLTITQPDALQAHVSKTDIFCYGGLDGSILARLQGGTAPYEIGIQLPGEQVYHWKTLSNGDSHLEEGLYSGTYTIRFRDANGCTVVDSQGKVQSFTLELTQPAEPLSLVTSKLTQPLGHGLRNGQIEAMVKGGTSFDDSSYSYTWKDAKGEILQTHTAKVENGQYHIVLDQIPAGTYTLHVTDKNSSLTNPSNNTGCYIEQVFRLPQPDPIVITVKQTAFISCFGAHDAALHATAIGGVLSSSQQDYTYSWFKIVAGTAQALNIHTASIMDVPAGDYRVRITDANQISQESDVLTIYEPALLQVKAMGMEVPCGDSASGIIRSEVTGGTAPYQYEWSNGATTADIMEAGVGKYFLYVTDANGCTATTQAIISTPSGLSLEFTVTPPNCYGGNDGRIALHASGGVQPLSYLWSDGTSDSVISNIRAGKYNVRIVDANGCVLQQQFTIQDPAKLMADAGPDANLCIGQSHTAVAKSSEAQVTYEWVGPDGFRSNQAIIEVSKAGSYQLSIRNAKGCVATDSFVLRVENIALEAEFVAATQLFAGQTSTLVNISTTEADRIEWIFPKDQQISLLNESDRNLALRFAKPGVYEISMIAYIGNCSKRFNKKITVLPADDMGIVDEDKGPFIGAFIVYPNPNNGQFTCKVTLAETSEIRLRLVNLSTGRTIDDKRHAGQQYYEIPYHLMLAPDLYVMLLEAKNEHRAFKIIVK